MTLSLVLASLLLLTPEADAAPDEPPARDYSGLFISWSGVNREAIRAETAPSRAAPASSGPLRAGSVALGERVGEIVRMGDCEAGERLAREAGDFPLVEAVRDHCRGLVPAASARR